MILHSTWVWCRSYPLGSWRYQCCRPVMYLRTCLDPFLTIPDVCSPPKLLRYAFRFADTAHIQALSGVHCISIPEIQPPLRTSSSVTTQDAYTAGDHLINLKIWNAKQVLNVYQNFRFEAAIWKYFPWVRPVENELTVQSGWMKPLDLGPGKIEMPYARSDKIYRLFLALSSICSSIIEQTDVERSGYRPKTPRQCDIGKETKGIHFLVGTSPRSLCKTHT